MVIWNGRRAVWGRVVWRKSGRAAGERELEQVGAGAGAGHAVTSTVKRPQAYIDPDASSVERYA